MGVQTRSSASSSPVKSKVPAKVTLPCAEGEPQTIFILPSDTSSDARFVLLQHPRDGVRRRFYFCPSKGIYEVTKISANMHESRSILFTPEEDVASLQARIFADKLNETTIIEKESAWSGIASDVEGSPVEGYVNKTAEIYVATTFDPIFILLPLLYPSATTSRTQSGEGLFRPFDDIIDEQPGDDRHLRHIINAPVFRATLLRAMSHVCDKVDAGDEQMYRLSMLKLYNYIHSKASRVVENGLPASMEERFVTRSLEVPMLSVKRVENEVSLATDEIDAATEGVTPDPSESQSSVISSSTSVAVSKTSSATSIGIVDLAPSEDLRHLQRLRTAMTFITASYLNPILGTKLAELSRDSKAFPDFVPLEEHLQHLAALRAEALSTRSLSDFSKKRNFDDDDEAAEERAEKKRKQEEDDKKKKSQESRGVRDLKKVNVSGMKKMSDFFAKKGPTAKSNA